MKKTLVALALVAATCGAFAQTKPAKAKTSVTAKADTTKKVKTVKKSVKAAPAKKAN